MSARFFSQTRRAANEEKPVEESEVKPAEEAVEAAEQPAKAAEQPIQAAEGVEGEPTCDVQQTLSYKYIPCRPGSVLLN